MNPIFAAAHDQGLAPCPQIDRSELKVHER